MGLDENRAGGTLRLTTGRMNTEAEIDRAAAAIKAAVESLQSGH